MQRKIHNMFTVWRAGSRLIRFCGGFIRNEAGQAMTEYVILMLVICTLCFWLYHPDNGFYRAGRNRFNNTALLLVMPGP